MEATENYPSLIHLLNAGANGFSLDPDWLSGERGTAFHTGPFSKCVPARIISDAGDVIQHVHLLMQRGRYDTPGSLIPVNNTVVDAAWTNAFDLHRDRRRAKATVFFKHQVNAIGQFQPYAPLFHCRETKRWFHPACPQCGVALTLCRDDDLLAKRGLPTYTGSLERFLYCGVCATLSDSSAFYVRDKKRGGPAIVHEAVSLVAQWKHLLAHLPDDSNFPCRGCPHIDACYGPESLASTRIDPVAFFPFYMMTFPAPSCSAVGFLQKISGDAAVVPPGTDDATRPIEPNRFLFEGQDRQFLEILYLKLTFLAQVYRQLMPAGDSAGVSEFGLTIEGLGVDLYPSGAGLPAYWNFDVRILDAIGSVQVSPFAPIMPQAPRLHFLGALWFRTLLVNSHQGADAVFAEVGRLVDGLTVEQSIEALAVDTSDSASLFATGQIFWVPDQRSLPENWIVHWKAAVRLGFQLVHAGLRAGASWDNGQFLRTIDELCRPIKEAMFAGSVAAPAPESQPVPRIEIEPVLRGILAKWQAEADNADRKPFLEVAPPASGVDQPIAPSPPIEPPLPPGGGSPPMVDDHAIDPPGKPEPEENSWDQDIEETVVFSGVEGMPPTGAPGHGVPEPRLQETQWNDDIEETVVLRTDAPTSPPVAEPDADDMDRTVIIAPSPNPPDTPPPNEDADLAATMVQHAPGPPPSSSDGADGDLEATVIFNTGGQPAPKREASSSDDDLAATLVQGAGAGPSASSPPSHIARPPAFEQSGNEDDLEATMVINPANRPAALNPPLETTTGPGDDDLAATLIETPRRTNPPGTQRPLTASAPPRPPVPPVPPAPPTPPSQAVQESQDSDLPARAASEYENDDDEVMAQTIIIRSDLKKNKE